MYSSHNSSKYFLTGTQYQNTLRGGVDLTHGGSHPNNSSLYDTTPVWNDIRRTASPRSSQPNLSVEDFGPTHAPLLEDGHSMHIQSELTTRLTPQVVPSVRLELRAPRTPIDHVRRPPLDPTASLSMRGLDSSSRLLTHVRSSDPPSQALFRDDSSLPDSRGPALSRATFHDQRSSTSAQFVHTDGSIAPAHLTAQPRAQNMIGRSDEQLGRFLDEFSAPSDIRRLDIPSRVSTHSLASSCPWQESPLNQDSITPLHGQEGDEPPHT
jgi:hypothetical protein